eukprot:NODE_1025_length_2025_cov_0.076324.p2 type:complete len:116 gc:universal NODE_1025_length_2025_cov_0.076324:860-513(-)
MVTTESETKLKSIKKLSLVILLMLIPISSTILLVTTNCSRVDIYTTIALNLVFITILLQSHNKVKLFGFFVSITAMALKLVGIILLNGNSSMGFWGSVSGASMRCCMHSNTVIMH